MPGDLKPIKLESRDLNSRDEDEQEPEYYLCLSLPFEECNKSCESQCKTKNSFDKTFNQDGKCYKVLASGHCPEGGQGCRDAFKCNCDITECQHFDMLRIWNLALKDRKNMVMDVILQLVI